MQVLKDEIRAAIIMSATNEFYEKGFEKASMRRIAKNANLSVGNLYHYFDHKEALFEAVVKPVYQRIVQHIQQQYDDELDKEHLLSVQDQQAQLFFGFLQSHRKVLMILIGGSKGTKFENIIEEMFEMAAEAMKNDHLIPYYQDKNQPEYIALARPIVVALAVGYWEIAKHHEDSEEVVKLAMEFSRIWVSGFKDFV